MTLQETLEQMVRDMEARARRQEAVCDAAWDAYQCALHEVNPLDYVPVQDMVREAI